MGWTPYKPGIISAVGFAVGNKASYSQLVASTGAVSIPTSTTALTMSGTYTTGISITGTATTGLTMNGTITKLMDLDYSSAGGDSPQAIDIDVAVLTGTSGFRQGALNIGVTRAAGQEFIATWDGNGDNAVKILARNYGNNLDGATRIGGVQAFNVQGRNSGTNLSWVTTQEVNARNDSGKGVTDLRGIHLRMENYGNIYTSNTGLDIEMSDENTTQSQTRTAVLIRNTDASGMSAVNNVFKISHTSTNGFTNLFYFNATSGDCAAAGTLTGSGGADILCDARITCSINGTAYYIPLYDTAP